MMTRELLSSHSVLGPGIVRARSLSPTSLYDPQHSDRYRSLAYSEVRLILCKLLFNFDVELRSECTNWIAQESYFLWDKPALWVTLKERIAST